MNTELPPPTTRQTTPRPGNRALTLWLLPWLVLAAALWAWAWPKLHERACWMQEWPFENACPQEFGTAKGGQPASVYQQHLQQNIGDSRALAWLLGAYWNEGDARAQGLLPHTLKLAPYEASVLAFEAETQLQAENWDGAAKALIALLERGHAEVRPGLLALMTSETTAPAVLRQLSADSVWLNGFLAGLDRNVPASALQPFISTGRDLGLLKPATVLGLIDRLKRDGAWIDAYTLWVAWQGEIAPGLYNGGFDRTALRRGFDWEWVTQPAVRQGFRIDQVPASPRPGLMLELTLTGRAAVPVPLLSQALILPGQRYRLRGRVMIDRLASRQGLVWALRCAGGGDRWAQSDPMLTTQRNWTEFDIEFTPPPECGAAVRLQLETTAPGEARAGMVGTVYFDDLALQSAGQGDAAATREKPAS